MALIASQIKELPYIVTYTNECGNKWEGYTANTPEEISKQGFISIYPASYVSCVKPKSYTFKYEKCDNQFLFLKTTFSVSINPKRKIESITSRVEDDIYGE